ncbi:hypothetical protein CTAYLR_005669 [Chrysophaeum taylorii]|uniref:Cleavage and polyadenylation specificity factor subunit 2 n=1 Tax=Chrysophaeum taylorii TaxID=2483200 RepID=A0AAD7XLZ9_9STRA|nr:hypothetical protein CTAYLR_005669 [Chrysophaeum taylorii]
MSSSSFFSWVSLHGAESDDAPYGSVLEVGGVRILLDCGSDGAFSPEIAARIAEVSASIDVVLISHHDLRHIGNLALSHARLGLRAPVFATLPCVKLGTMTLYETWLGLRCAKGREEAAARIGTLDEIDEAVQRIRTLRFEQPLELRGKGAGIVITAHRAGYSIGGSAWRVARAGADVVYLVDARHATERHAPAAAIVERPAVLVVDARALDRGVSSVPKREAEEKLVSKALERLRAGGTVLLPVDATTRLVELALVFDEAWRDKKLGGAYDLVIVHAMARTVLELARTQLEWMAPSVQKLDVTKTRPLGLLEARVVTSVEEALQVNAAFPKCILAARAELDYGASAAILRFLAADKNALVLSTSRRFASPTDISWRLPRRWDRGISTPLSGPELEAYVASREAAREQQEREDDLRRRAAELADDLDVLRRKTEEESEEVPPPSSSSKQQPLPSVVEQQDNDDDGGEDRDSIAKKKRRVESLMHNPWFEMSREERAKAHPAIVWMDLFPPRPPEPPSDEYGQPIPTVVLEAIEAAKSTHLGLETREGFDYLLEEGEGRPPPPQKKEEEEERMVSREGDCAYDEGDDNYDPSRWERGLVEIPEPACAVARVDGLDGLCDARSLKNLLARIRPRAVVVAPSPSSRALAAFVADKITPVSHAPDPLVPVDLSDVLGRAPLVDAHLSWALVDKVNKHQLHLGDGFTVARINDAVLIDEDDNKKVLVSVDEIDDADLFFGDDNELPPPPLWVSSKDLVLPALKEKLEAVGVRAEFRAGTLVCAGSVLVRKVDAGNKRQHVRIDGPLCPEYFQVAAVLKTALTLV